MAIAYVVYYCVGARHGCNWWSDVVEGFHLCSMLQCSWPAWWGNFWVKSI